MTKGMRVAKKRTKTKALPSGRRSNSKGDGEGTARHVEKGQKSMVSWKPKEKFMGKGDKL